MRRLAPAEEKGNVWHFWLRFSAAATVIVMKPRFLLVFLFILNIIKELV